ncbi:hypothetical protein [uncultured Ruminococcus sp.]|uniref:hypothetical protein n=1 Tax=uncultured Ruminococcus sp. TaxID=165186 RepID=UPI0025F2776A|nr:hypothetical protein [uncultured Ruminococcus sp.]
MMDYKEMAEIVTREVDAILERKKIRAKRIKKLSLAVSGLCAAVIVGVGAWHFSSDIKKPDDGFKGSGIISETETTTANAVTTTKVTTVTADTTETKTTETTAKATTVITTSEVSKITSRIITTPPIIPARTTSLASTVSKTTSTNKSTTTNTTLIQNATTSKATTTSIIPSTFTPTTGVFTVVTTTQGATTATSTQTTTSDAILANPTTTYVIGFEDIDKEEIRRIVSAKKSEYENSLIKEGLDAKEIEKLVTDYAQKLNIDLQIEGYKQKATEILLEIGADIEKAEFYNFTPNVRCPLTDEQYEKALRSPKVIRINQWHIQSE